MHVQVGGAYSYDCSFGYIPNVELMKFISLATFGSYLPSCPEVDLNSEEMNAYHKAFLTYSFLKSPESMNSEYFCGETTMYKSDASFFHQSCAAESAAECDVSTGSVTGCNTN